MEAENPVLSSTGLSDNDRGVMKDEFHAATLRQRRCTGKAPPVYEFHRIARSAWNAGK
jgi:hypothetical protein